MEYLIIICKAVAIATAVTFLAMGSIAALLAFFPDLVDDEACRPENGDDD